MLALVHPYTCTYVRSPRGPRGERGPGRVSRRFTERTNEMTRALSEIATAILPVPIANLSAVNKGLQIAISETFSNEAYFRVLLDEHF